MDRTQVDKFIKIFERFGSDECTYTQLGMRALYEIATLPEEVCGQVRVILSTGESKMVDEMTIRELREVRKALREAQEFYVFLLKYQFIKIMGGERKCITM